MARLLQDPEEDWLNGSPGGETANDVSVSGDTSPARQQSPHNVYTAPSAVRPAGVARPETIFPHKRAGAFAQHDHLRGSIPS